MTDINQTDWNEVDSSNNAASPNGWAAGMLPSAVEPSARAIRGALKRFYNQVSPTVTSGGSANVQTLTYAVARTAYVAGDPYAFKAGFSNTGATTLNVNALGAKAVQLAGRALLANDITSGFYYGVVYDGTNFQLMYSSARSPLGAPAAVNAFPANPTATTSTSLVMMGLGASAPITPNRSGTLLFIISGNAQNTTAGSAFAYQLRYGTGAAPANGAALAGTLAATQVNDLPNSTGNAVPFSTQGIITGLTIGTAYWFDLGLAAVIAGTANVTGLTMSAGEL
jgi:hypothetical protein